MGNWKILAKNDQRWVNYCIVIDNGRIFIYPKLRLLTQHIQEFCQVSPGPFLCIAQVDLATRLGLWLRCSRIQHFIMVASNPGLLTPAFVTTPLHPGHLFPWIPYSLNQTLRLLFISSRNSVRLLFKSGYYLRAAFIKLRTEDEEMHCLKQGGVAADAWESIRRDAATLVTVTDTKLEESDPCTDVE